VISQKCIRWYGLDLGPARFITPESLTKYEDIRYLRSGDLLWNSTGTGTIGRACLVPQDLDDAGLVADSHVTVVRPVSLDSVYLWRWIQSPYVQNEIEGSASGTTNQIELNTSTVINQVIPVPPLAEQSRIVTRVEELMQLCDALEASGQRQAQQHAQLVNTLLGTLTQSETPEALANNWQRIATHFDVLLDRPEAVDALEQTILQLAVRGLLVPQDPTYEPASVLLQKIRTEKDHLITQGKIKRDKPLPPITDEEKPFELPQGWEWVRFGQIANIASNLVPPSLHPKKWQVAPDCIEKATGRLLHKRTVAQAEIVSPNHLFKPGQLLYSKIRPSLSKAVLVDFEGLCSADMYPIESQLDMEFLLLYILSEPFLEQVSIAENRVKMPKLNQEALVAFMVAVPPLVAQAKIVKRVSELRSLCTDLRERITAGQAAQAHLADALLTSK
jgi:type I restriction enzyme S subunit